MVVGGMNTNKVKESTLHKIGLRPAAGWLGAAGVTYDTTQNQDFEPSRRNCLSVILTGSFNNTFYQLGIRPRAWLESTFIQRSKRGQYLKAVTMSIFDKHSNSQSVRATTVAVRFGSSPNMAASANDAIECMVLRNSPFAE